MITMPYLFQIGAIRGQILADGHDVLTLERVARMFPDHADQIQAASGKSLGTMSRNILLMDVGDERILIDSGEGNMVPESPGTLFASLAIYEIDLDSIDTVIITHFHLDHIGGLLDGHGKPTFPNARLVASKAEFDHWMNENFLATMEAFRANLLRQTFDAYTRVDLIAGEVEVAPGVTLLPAYGHTPGHSAVLIESEGSRLLHIVDAMHLPAQINLPDARPKYDSQPEIAVATRHALINRAESENLQLLVYHFAFPGLGHIRRDGDRRVWDAV